MGLRQTRMKGLYSTTSATKVRPLRQSPGNSNASDLSPRGLPCFFRVAGMAGDRDRRTTVDDAWKTSLRDGFRESFDLFERALRDCPHSLWEASLWPVTARPPIRHGLGAELPEAARRQAYSAFWFVAWHTLNVAHYDIEGEELPRGWGAPPPFDTYITDRRTPPPRVWTRDEILEHSALTWRRTDEIVAGLTDERVARPVPAPTDTLADLTPGCCSCA